ncbi:hypothetical protein [uncultured Aquimarina sp.]|uniref:hypothetical protein n=1 Tax=uncultured Aquimarina sp. TaxID=575652 RepID=UPI002623E925|nr:hypothetical protein [uncultured Aquimarina sp.]
MKIFIEDTIKGVHTSEHKSTIYSCYDYFKNLSEHHDSEIKLFKSDSNNYIASFNWYGINQWKIDCPVELYEIHRQQYATTEECVLLIKKLYQYGNLDNEDKFIDVPIQHFTLNEMIEFRQEDKMMLRGEDPDMTSSSSSQSPSTIKSSSPKTDNESSLVLGEQLDKKQGKDAISQRPKNTVDISKKSKPIKEKSFFSI